jgi:hypothetical protein
MFASAFDILLNSLSSIVFLNLAFEFLLCYEALREVRFDIADEET